VIAEGNRLNLTRALPESSPAAASSPPRVESGAAERVLSAEEMLELERANILRALASSGLRVAGEGGAADLLGLPASTLASRMKALGIRRPRGA
jgi:transcriptional regulator with GAF, ATPase, and Fis domain